MKRYKTILLTALLIIGIAVPSSAIGVNNTVSGATASQPSDKGVKFENGPLSQVLEKAKKNKKSKNGPSLVLIDCYTTWCVPCKFIDTKVFPLEHVGEYLNSNFLTIKIDMEKGEGIEIAEKYSVTAFPTFLILDSDGNEVGRAIGGGDADTFLNKIKKAMNPENDPSRLKERYQESRQVGDAIKYLDTLKTLRLTDQANSFIEEIFSQLPARDKYSQTMWPYIAQALNGKGGIDLIEKLLAERHHAYRSLGSELPTWEINRAIKGFATQYVRGELPSQNNESGTKQPVNSKNSTQNSRNIAEQTTHNSQQVEKLIKLVNQLPILSPEDPTISYFIEAVNAYSRGNIERIGYLLNVERTYQLGRSQRYSVEQLLLYVKGLPKEAIKKYRQAEYDYLNSQLNYLKRVIESI